MEITKDLLEYLTRERTIEMWGDKYTGYDCLIDEQHGDGNQLVCFQTMDSRPFSYIIRVDSSLDLDNGYNEILPEDYEHTFVEMLILMVEEEHDNIAEYEYIGQGLYTHEMRDTEPFEYKFPMLSLGGGYSYKAIDIERLKSKIS